MRYKLFALACGFLFAVISCRPSLPADPPPAVGPRKNGPVFYNLGQFGRRGTLQLVAAHVPEWNKKYLLVVSVGYNGTNGVDQVVKLDEDVLAE